MQDPEPFGKLELKILVTWFRQLGMERISASTFPSIGIHRRRETPRKHRSAKPTSAKRLRGLGDLQSFRTRAFCLPAHWHSKPQHPAPAMAQHATPEQSQEAV